MSLPILKSGREPKKATPVTSPRLKRIQSDKKCRQPGDNYYSCLANINAKMEDDETTRVIEEMRAYVQETGDGEDLYYELSRLRGNVRRLEYHFP